MEAGIKKSTKLMLRPQSTQDNKRTTRIKSKSKPRSKPIIQYKYKPSNDTRTTRMEGKAPNQRRKAPVSTQHNGQI
jgi:hypothetical protein